MNFKPDGPSIVMVGAWNPAILNPTWLAQEVFGVPRGQSVPVEIQVQMDGVMAVIPRFVLQRLKFLSTPDRLSLSPSILTLPELDRTEVAVRTILERLSHTPIRGLGFNFACEEEQPTPDQLAVFSSVAADLTGLQFTFDATETQITSSLEFEGRTLNLTRKLSGGRLQIAFNFHYKVSSAEEALGVLQPNGHIFRDNYAYFRRVMNSLYQSDIDPISGETHAGQPVTV